LLALGDELGVELFRHQGNRLVGLTEPGAMIADITTKILDDVGRIRDIAAAQSRPDADHLVVVASRHAAGNRVRRAVLDFRTQAPAVALRLCEENPLIARAMLVSGAADIGILPEQDEAGAALSSLPIDQWTLSVVVPTGHPLVRTPRLTLELLGQYPICSYERGAASRQAVDTAFSRVGLDSPVHFSLGSSADILDYIASGAGVGIVATGAFESSRHPDLCALDTVDLFPALTTAVVINGNAPLRGSVVDFIGVLAPEIDRDSIERAMRLQSGRRG
jgi:DNA-binding transcriptional LysR family regulator